ncbi:MAG: tRNA (adenosine(37)-N6)-threonylcarbamoyltransferase complex ATPase subunit type 1 TsaE [Flavisolibacter sp.]
MEVDVFLNELEPFAAIFWKNFGAFKIFAFYGAMGAGKTTLIISLCRSMGVKAHLSSPTFSIINQYSIEKEDKEETIYHIDLYRLESEEEILQTGVDECLASGSICMVEWPEKASWLFNKDTVHILIENTGKRSRRVEIKHGYLPDAIWKNSCNL